MTQKKESISGRLMTWACRKAVTFVVKHRGQMLTDHVTRQAAAIGAVATMRILDREGIAHCHVCPGRFGLRKLKGGKGGYACALHPETKEVGSAKAA